MLRNTKPKIKFYCSRWGHELVPWQVFAAKVKQHFFCGVEVIALRYPEQINDMLDSLEKEELEYNLIYTQRNADCDFEKYLVRLKNDMLEIATSYCRPNLKPRYIIAQIGREYYTKQQMRRCFDICNEISEITKIAIIQETHRYRWSYAAHVVKDYLNVFPDLKLALDLSHWFCVSESYLTDQAEAVELALSKTVHLHARVGHTQGPQVTDPRSPENAEPLSHHLIWWDKWIDVLTEKGVEECTITPEFGPTPYMVHTPYLNTPLSDLWSINCWMKDLLTARYN